MSDETKPKLKTMNDISAAEAQRLFHKAMVFDDGLPHLLYMPVENGFPKDIAARDFMECLDKYRKMWSDGLLSSPDVVTTEMVKDMQHQELLNLRYEELAVKEDQQLRELTVC